MTFFPQFKESALARQSLYVKFDPLVKGQSPGNHGNAASTMYTIMSIEQL